MITLPKSSIEDRSKERPPGYFEDVMSHGREIEGGFVEFTEEAFHELVKKYEGSRVTRFFTSLTEWASAGFSVVDKDVFDIRTATCVACGNSDGSKNWVNGMCRLCTCRSLKLVFPHERCPIGKW